MSSFYIAKFREGNCETDTIYEIRTLNYRAVARMHEKYFVP